MANLGPPPQTTNTLLDRWLVQFWRLVGALPVANLSGFAALPNFANDTAAATGGVPVGGMYRNGSVLMVRVS